MYRCIYKVIIQVFSIIIKVIIQVFSIAVFVCD